MNKNHAIIKMKYATLYSELEEILFRYDPVGINFGDNTDEYDNEVNTILPRLKAASNKDDVLDIVHEELCRWFDVEVVGKKSRAIHKEIAAEIWSSWLKFSRPII